MKGRWANKLALNVRRCWKNGKDVNLNGPKLAKAKRLVKMHRCKMDEKVEEKLLGTSLRRRNAIWSLKKDVVVSLREQRDSQAWMMLTGEPDQSSPLTAFPQCWKNHQFWGFGKMGVVSTVNHIPPEWDLMSINTPKVLITHNSKEIPPWLQLHIGLGGFYVMNSQCFDSRAYQGNCLKHKPWISMHKFVYISEQVRQSHPSCVAAIEHAAS